MQYEELNNEEFIPAWANQTATEIEARFLFKRDKTEVVSAPKMNE